MSVIHVDPVLNYENCLRVGGEGFEITDDEMHALEEMVPTGESALIPIEQLAERVPDGTWSGIARMLSERRATFSYSLSRAGVYRVTCKAPPPEADQGTIAR